MTEAVTKAPDAYRTISEVSELLNVPPHVLRFWETKFSAVKPLKRSGGRRFYRPEDIALLQDIRRMLHDEGYTIKGVQRVLEEAAGRMRGRDTPSLFEFMAPLEKQPAQADLSKTDLLAELGDIRKLLKSML